MYHDRPIESQFKHIELEINTVCNTNCFGCDRFSDIASKGVPAMTVDQVAFFVEESLALEWEWERIRLLGGEPTLHKDFVELVNLIIEYRKYYPNCFLQILTNGIGEKPKEYREWLVRNNVSLHAETKEKGVTPEWFHNTRIVQVDRDPNCGEVSPCGIYGIRGCGIGLTNAGYFLDGAGASVARVAGYDIGIMRLEDVTHEAMIEQSKILCRVCGHWNPDDHLLTEKVTKTGEVTGPFWTERLAEYKENKPILKVYGRHNPPPSSFPLKVV